MKRKRIKQPIKIIVQTIEIQKASKPEKKNSYKAWSNQITNLFNATKTLRKLKTKN